MDHKELLKAVKKAGWVIEKRNHGHLKIIAPDGRFMFTASTPSDWRGTLNLAADLRRLGLDV